ncbi:MAG: hypothetical protein KKC18_07830 [Chloroflexi bacterium]|nr:hypothetical protein [Chloroflexota bacterium]
MLEANDVHPDQRYHLEMLQTEEGLIQGVAVPVFEGRAGVARVGMSLRRLDDTLAEVTRRFLLTTLLVSLLGMVVSTALTWLLTRPVLAVAAWEAQEVVKILLGRGELLRHRLLVMDMEAGTVEVLRLEE